MDVAVSDPDDGPLALLRREPEPFLRRFFRDFCRDFCRERAREALAFRNFRTSSSVIDIVSTDLFRPRFRRVVVPSSASAPP